MNVLFRLFLTFNATSLIIVVFLAKEKFLLSDIVPWLGFIPDFSSYIIYIIIPILLTFTSLHMAKYLDTDSIVSDKKPVIKEIEQANNAFLPSYLGYFFVALSVPYYETLFFVFAILFVFTFLSQTLYFNPLYLIFGYHFYYITTCTNIKIFVISKRKLKDPENLVFARLKRINDFTFIDEEV